MSNKKILIPILLIPSMLSALLIFATFSNLQSLLTGSDPVTAIKNAIPKPYAVYSGSMEPSIKTGSLVFIIPSKNYYSGDIVTFRQNESAKTLITHRIEAKLFPTGSMGEPIYLTSGDASEDFDQWRITDKQIVGKVFLTIPYLGYVTDFAKKPFGFILFVIIPATILVYEELKFVLKEFSKSIRKKIKKDSFNLQGASFKGSRTIYFQKLLAIVPILGAGLVFTGLASSFFSDTETSTDNVFQAAESFGTDHLVISEVQTTGGTGGGQDQLTDRDFIEIYNPTSTSINLVTEGYRLAKRTGSGVPTSSNVVVFTGSHVIPAHGFFLWASSESPGYAASIGANVSTSVTLAISNNSVALIKGTLESGIIIDALSWSSISGSYTEGTRFTPDLAANQSMERKAYSTSTAGTMEGGADSLNGNGFDSDNNATDFILRTVSQPQNSTTGGTELP